MTNPELLAAGYIDPLAGAIMAERQQTEALLDDFGLTGDYSFDHIGIQAGSSEAYEKLKAAYSSVAQRMAEKIMSGRRLAVFALATTDGGELKIELFEPKPGAIDVVAGLKHFSYVCSDVEAALRYVEVSGGDILDVKTINKAAVAFIKGPGGREVELNSRPLPFEE